MQDKCMLNKYYPHTENIYILISLVFVGALSWFIATLVLKSRTVSKTDWKQVNNALDEARLALASQKAKLESALEEKSGLIKQVEELKDENRTKAADINALNGRLAELNAYNNALQERLDAQKKGIEDLGEKFQVAFENIANKILDDKTQKFTEQNKDNLKVILDPLGAKIREFQQKSVKVGKRKPGRSDTKAP